MLKTFLKAQIPMNVLIRMGKLRSSLLAFLYRGNLVKLAILFRTNKWGEHWYMPHYEQHFRAFRKRAIKILEIGVATGASLRMWKAYFRKGLVGGLDIVDKHSLAESRIQIFRGDQSDPETLRQVARKMGGIDIVIDDGSHINAHMIASFETLFPLLNDGGIYVIEDLCCGYWPGFGGSSEIGATGTAVSYFKGLIDCLHFEEIVRPDYKPTYFDRHIVKVCFHHNLVFIYKGENLDGSNGLKNNIPFRDFVIQGLK
jgi:hypothetical protein